MKRQAELNRTRLNFMIAMIVFMAFVLVSRIVFLQVFNRDFLQNEGEARYLRTIEVHANRGMILDRNNKPLAISTPVDSIWVNPSEVNLDDVNITKFTKVVGITRQEFVDIVKGRSDKNFVYIKRKVEPAVTDQVKRLNLDGVYLQREYRRYYPSGEITSHIIGFTNVDDQGQEGLELAFNDWLTGHKGKVRLIKDRLGRYVEEVERIKTAETGKNLILSIDRRVQYLAYRELKAAILRHNAVSGTIVILNAKTAEVVALVNQPSFNPNNRSEMSPEVYRNRAVTDVFEPGSTLKPFTIATALKSGLYRPTTIVDTSPGEYNIGNDVVKDVRNYGKIDLSTIIQKSSNVGASKIALSLPAGQFWETFALVGFGAPTGNQFPGESHGILKDYGSWSEFEQATLSFGYGISVTPLQLAHAYTIFAGDGRLRPVSFLKTTQEEQDKLASDPIFTRQVISDVRSMLEQVTGVGGTATTAQVNGYRVAGKTGTVKKIVNGVYSENKYLALFAGMIPASDPELVMVVVINEPRNGRYYGGQVAAPVFSKVMTGAVRILDIPPDQARD